MTVRPGSVRAQDAHATKWIGKTSRIERGGDYKRYKLHITHADNYSGRAGELLSGTMSRSCESIALFATRLRERPTRISDWRVAAVIIEFHQLCSL